MTEILKEWLTDRLEEPIFWNPTEFGEAMKNGHTIASLLLSYHIINKNKYDLIKRNNNDEDIRNNWAHLSQWLREINIPINDTDLRNIQIGKNSTVLRLFYQLFLNLDKRDRTNFIKRESKIGSNLKSRPGSRFTVEEIEEPSIEYLSKPLMTNKQFIEWQKKKAAKIQGTYDFFKSQYLKSINQNEETTISTHKTQKTKVLSAKEKMDMENFDKKYPFKLKCLTYEQLMEHIKKVEENKPDNFLNKQWAKDYIKQLQGKFEKQSITEQFHDEMGNILSESLWNHSVDGEEKKSDKELARKVMKLSQFEKQMCTKIMETKQQSRNLIKNRIEAEKLIADQREKQFDLYLDNIKEQIYLEIGEIQFEQYRQNTLHKKLYEEKRLRKRQYYYGICYDTMLSIVDFVCKCTYYRQLMGENEIPERFVNEWKTLYFKMQPIFDLLAPTEKILEDKEIHEEIDLEIEMIINLELERQQTLNHNDFDEYHNYLGRWKLESLIPNYQSDAEECLHTYLGSRVLGHVVYNLLEIKYPYPPERGAPDIPIYSSKSLIRGLPDRALITPMQILLNFRKILVVRLESAIIFCLKKFKSEMIGVTNVDLSFDSFLEMSQYDEDKDLINLMREEADSNSDIYDETNVTLLPNIKQTQTPQTLPEEDIVLSNSAELGKYAYRSLAAGDSLTDHLISAMLMEYIRDQSDINGFVIVNYPNSYRQAQVLEETFVGQAPPDEEYLDDSDDIYLEESIQKHRKVEKDVYKSVRVSKLVADPHNKSEEKPFTSFFTSYIYLKKSDDILAEDDVWKLNQENSDLIDRFYASFGMNYSILYEVIDRFFLAQICRFVIGDFEVPPKSDDELFGENVLSTLEYPSEEKNKSKLMILSTETNKLVEEEESQKGSLKRGSLSNLDEQAEESVWESVVQQFEILPGEENWEYGNLTISESIGLSLATVWEEMEKSYIGQIEQLLFAVRLQMNCLIPYARFIKDKIEQIVAMPSVKQDLVCKFQNDFNNFEDDYRDMIVSKNEWHCRVKELRSELYHICDERKILAENQKAALIIDNWTMDELTTMANTYVSCMQAEMNRCLLVNQTLNDFYFLMLRRLPSLEKVPFPKELTKISREIEDNLRTTVESENEIYKQLKSAFQEMHTNDIELDYSNNPFNVIVENNVKVVFDFVKGLNETYKLIINKELTEIQKIVSVQKAPQDDTDSKGSTKSDEIFKENALKCIKEWSMGINGEMYSTCMRINVLQNMCHRDMKQFNDYITKTFMEVQDYIDQYYSNEIKSVERLCKYIQLKIEDSQKIPETLILEHDRFVIDPNLLQYAPLTKEMESVEDKEDYKGEFRIGQLARMRDMFRIVAPTGVILEQSFIYLLQDFILYSKESCEGPVVPETWKHVDPKEIPKLVQVLFGQNFYIDWKDFLICCLNIRYPSVEELLEIRNVYLNFDSELTELICRDKFMEIDLWFEKDFTEHDNKGRLRGNLTKNFLFEIFETSTNVMNYSAFLLAFCKNVNPVEGFASAVSICIGKKLCFEAECKEVIEELIKHKMYKDECRACALKCAEELLDKAINDVLDFCEGTIITEMESSPRQTDTHKQDEDMNDIKKEIEKMYSSVNVKSTFLCGSCGTEEAEESKTPSMQVAMLSPKLETKVAYSVSQSFIWKVLKISLPWYFDTTAENFTAQSLYAEQIMEVVKRLKTLSENGEIYFYNFVSDPIVCNILNRVKKFTAFNLIKEATKFVYQD